jgi:predicted dehydrogenase
MLNWGVIGAGGIAKVFCNGMRFSKTGQIAAVASRSPERAAQLATTFAIPKQYNDYDALLADAEIEAVYICVIHPAHAEWAIKAAKAGKHILVEKPIGMNYSEAEAMIAAARENDVFLMEAFMYRCHPQTHKLAALVREGAIGQVRMIRAVFSYDAGPDPTSRAYSNKLGGGGILDVGCYPASMTRLIAGAASDQPFLDPIQVKGCAKVGPTGVDHYAAATLQFENDIIAEIITGVGCQMPSEVSIYGTAGMLSVPNPWLPASPCRDAKEPLPLDTVFPSTSIKLWHPGKSEPEEIIIAVDRDLFTYEADTVAENIVHRQSPTMSWDDTLGNMKLLDQWRREGGIVYDSEKTLE